MVCTVNDFCGPGCAGLLAIRDPYGVHAICARRGGLGRARRTVLPVRAIGAPPDAGPPPPPPPPPRPPRRTRLAASVISAPRQLDDYFEGSLYRRALWTCIAFAAGARPQLGSSDRLKGSLTVPLCGAVPHGCHRRRQAPSRSGRNALIERVCTTVVACRTLKPAVAGRMTGVLDGIFSKLGIFQGLVSRGK